MQNRAGIGMEWGRGWGVSLVENVLCKTKGAT
jgi:hypothetical protein